MGVQPGEAGPDATDGPGAAVGAYEPLDELLEQLDELAAGSFLLLEPLLEAGCRVWLTPPPFDHSKLMVVDGGWTFLGSANWDPRSLVLNFELNVECYDAALAAEVDRLIECRRQDAEQLTLGDVRRRSLPVKLRDNVARLFSPLL